MLNIHVKNAKQVYKVDTLLPWNMPARLYPQNRKSVLSDAVRTSSKPVNGDNTVGPKVVGFG